MLHFKKYLTICLCLVMFLVVLVSCDREIPSEENETSETTSTLAGQPETNAHVHSFGDLKKIDGNDGVSCDQKKYYKSCSTCAEVVFVNGTHSIVTHPAKEPTCTESGWSAYETCTECDYTTYQELPAQHNYNSNHCCTVCGKADLLHIEVVEETIPKEIPIATNPDFSGIRVIATYEDGTTKEVGVADGVTVDPVDTTKAASKKVTVKFGGKSTQFTVQIVDPEATATVVSIKIVVGTIQTSFYRNEVVNYNDLQIEATMSTGIVRNFGKSEVTYAEIDTSTVGEKIFEVSYNNGTEILKDSIKVTVVDIKEILVVNNSLAKKVFVGEAYDTFKYQLHVVYADDSSVLLDYEETPLGAVTIGSIDTSTAGKKNLTITYNGFVQNYEVEVVGVKKLEINQGSYPTKVLYGGLLNTINISGVVTFTDDTMKPLTRADLSVATFTANTIGANQITVAYNRYGGISTTINVEVLGVQSMTIVSGTLASGVVKGEILNTNNLKVVAVYTDGSTAVIQGVGLNIGTIDTSIPGEHSLSITYLNMTITHTVRVYA